MKNESCSVVSDSSQPHGLHPLWNSLGQNTGMGSLSLFQGMFPTKGSNPGLLHCRLILYQLSHKGLTMGSSKIMSWFEASDINMNHALEKEMATHSSVLAWRIPGTGKPGGLPSMESYRVGHNWSDLAAAATKSHFLYLFFFKRNVIIKYISSVAQSYPTHCNPMNCSTPGLPVHHQLPRSLKLMSIQSVMPSSHVILCHLLFLLPPIPPSIGVFSNE